jgi:hypothetical protein
MGAALNDLTPFKHNNFIRIPYCAQAMRDDNASTSAASQIFVDAFFYQRVEGACGLI